MYKCLLLAILVACVSMVVAFPGGYLAKGGVMDFKKPLDYMSAAKHAGHMAWDHKLQEESDFAALEINRGARQTAKYTPVFYTSAQGLAPPPATAQQHQPVFGYFRSA